MCVRVRAGVRARAHVCVCAYMCVCVCVCACMCVHASVCMHLLYKQLNMKKMCLATTFAIANVVVSDSLISVCLPLFC